MMLRFVALVGVLSAFVSSSSALHAEPYPDYQSIYVNDFANVLEPETEAQLTATLEAIRSDHGIEMTVVTIETIETYDPSPSWEAFATRLFNGWGIGDPDRNDGVLFLFAMTDRTMRLELGSGYHRDWDEAASDIVQSIMVPNFKTGDVNGGVRAGVSTMVARLRQNIAEGRAPTETPFGSKEVTMTADGVTITSTRYQAPAGGYDWVWYMLIAPLAGGGAYLTRRFLRMRPRACQACGTRMQLVDEVSDDQFLDEGSQLEESIKSVDYDVWNCPSCDHIHIERWRNWISRYGACKACGYRALESDRTTVRSPTYSSEGLARIDYNCVNCGHYHSETKRIARLTKSSSSSSGSSFSGGRSSGGGASGSW